MLQTISTVNTIKTCLSDGQVAGKVPCAGELMHVEREIKDL